MTRRIGTGLCVLRFFFTLSGTGHERVFLGLSLSLASSIISFGGGLGLRREGDLCRFFRFSAVVPAAIIILDLRFSGSKRPLAALWWRLPDIGHTGGGWADAKQRIVDR